MQNIQYDYLDGRYEPLAILGNNAKQSTYLAKDEVSGQIVVKKYIQRENADVYERISTLHSRNLVNILYVARGARDALVIMEYISGKTIEEYLKEKVIFSEKETFFYMEQLLMGLKMIHGQGIIHRDINPRNVLISTDGVIKILDFDIGRQYKMKQECDTRILGTAGYAAPEQFGFTQSDTRTDIYAVGVLMNVMLTGVLPRESLYRNGRISYMIKTCIQIDPDNRYQRVEEMLFEIRQSTIDISCKRNGEDEKSEKEEAIEQIVEEQKSIWPGFRSDKLWKKIIAVSYYICMGIYSVACIVECAKTPLAVMLEAIAIVMYIWLAVLVPFDFLHWMDKTPGIKKLKRAGRIVLGVVLWMLLFYYGILLENYVRIDMLHIATPSIE